jgi:ADP-heptose:LPS heptosyltransferase
MVRRTVLIFQAGGLGDFVLTWPFAAALGRVFPQSRVTYVTHGQKGKLVQRLLRLESTDLDAGWHGLFGGGEMSPAIGRVLEGTRAVFTFLPVTDAWRQNIGRLTGGADVAVIDPNPPVDFAGHATDFVVGQLQNYPVEAEAARQLLRSVAARGIAGGRTRNQEIVIHPGAGGATKRWPAESFVALAHTLANRGRKVRFVTGEVEAENWSPAERAAIESAAPVTRCATLIELAEIVGNAGVFVGNDSGPGHLAGILGTPTVSIFGPTDPGQWKPLGPAVTVIRGQPISDVSVDQVIEAVGARS